MIFCAMVSMAAHGIVPPLRPKPIASAADWRAIFSIWLALSADCLMVEAISSIRRKPLLVEEACSRSPREAVRPWPSISWAPADTLLAEEMASAITSRSGDHAFEGGDTRAHP